MRGYKFTVSGTFYASSEMGKSKMQFYRDEVFYMPRLVKYVVGRKYEYYPDPVNPKLEKKRSVLDVREADAVRVATFMLKHHYLPPRLRDKYPGYYGLATVLVTKQELVKSLSGKHLPNSLTFKNIDKMDESDLLQFAALHDLNTGLTDYPTLADKRMAIEMEYVDREKGKPNARAAKPENPDLQPVAQFRGEITSEMMDAGTKVDETDPAEALLA